MCKDRSFCRDLFLIALLLIIVFFSGAMVPLDTLAQPPLLDSATPVAVRGGQANLWLRLGDGHDVPVSFSRKNEDSPLLQAGIVIPAILAGEDFDADGYADLICGYNASGSGLIALYRGNPQAFAPTDPDFLKNLAAGKTPSPFLSEASVIALPAAPDFLAAGDFSGDGWPDILAGARGSSSLYILRGDGIGSFTAPEAVPLPGVLTALTTGNIDRPTGRSSVIAGVNGIGGPKLVIFEGADDLSDDVPCLCPLPAPASELALGQLDDAIPMDLAILAEGQILILHGRDQTSGTPDNPAQRLEPLSLSSEGRSMALGRFIWTRTSRTQIAVLDTAGTLSLLNSGVPDSRPFTFEEAQARRLALFEHRQLPDQTPASEWAPGRSSD
jgi:trimeric autotransporter adhesin